MTPLSGSFESKIVVLLLLLSIVGMMMIGYCEGSSSPSLKLRANGPDAKVRMREQINRMENMCLLTMSGLDCPGKTQDINSKTSLLRKSEEELPIIAGVGYNRVDKSINPPILKSQKATLISETRKLVRTIKGAADYFSMLYPPEGSEIFNGLYSHGPTVTDIIFRKYFEGDLTGFNIQKQFHTHAVQVSNLDVTDEFKKIIDILPNQMDEDLYNMVITSFGDSIATKVTYGGVIDLTTAVRTCYSNANMEQYLDVQLQLSINNETDTTKLPNGYMRYQKVASIDIVGGNPQLANINQRIASFAQNPVPIKMETIPIWRAFPNGPKQDNMKTIYNKYIAANSMSVSERIAQIEAKRNADKLAPQPFYAFKANSTSGYVEKLGSGNPVYIKVGGTAELTEEYIITKYKSFHRVFKVVIERNQDGSFYFHFVRVKCDRQQNCVDRDEDEQDDTPSTTVKDNCAVYQMNVRGLYRPSAKTVYVCSGCMPVPSSDFKTLSCQCPYVE